MIGVGTRIRALAHSVLYLHHSTLEASRKAISGRTSYRRVRLVFRRYPQVIPRFFNTDGFEPSRRISCASLCPWVGHSVSGLWHATSRPIRTRFRCGSRQSLLTSLRTITRRFILQEARGHPLRRDWAPTACRHTVSGPISLPSRGAFHLSLTVLVHYRSLRVFSLGRWSSRIRTGFHVSRATWERAPERSSAFAYRAITVYGEAFAAIFG